MATFGYQLRNLIFASDYLTDLQFDRTAKLLADYSSQLGFERLDLLILTKFEGEEALSYELRSNHHDCMPYRLHREKQLNGLCPLSVVKEKPIWIVTANPSSESVYDQGSRKIDLWSGLTEIPDAQGFEASAKVQTEVVVPVRSTRRCIGAISFRSAMHIPASDQIRNEILTIAQAIGSAYQTLKESELRASNTTEALENLSTSSSKIRILKEGKARIFMAFPENCDRHIVDTIKESVDKFETLEGLSWDQNYHSGSINEKIVEDILGSDLGIAYFSEFSSTGENKYHDNPNVLFEAGMFESCQKIGGRGPLAWIPVREASSEGFPFDIASLNTVIVRRDENGNPIGDVKREISSRISAILDGLSLI